jgi:hypothetical protein
MGEITEIPELTECLYRIDDDVMYFNFNWIPEESNPIPLKTILDLLHKHIDVEILFHDVIGKGIYKVKLVDFIFERIYGLRNYDWDDGGLKELEVQYNFREEQIVV